MNARKKMKTFAGNKPLIQIKRQCRASGVAYDDYNFRKLGRDFVCLGVAAGKRPDGSPFVRASGANGWVLYNTFNGRFFGVTDKGVEFDSGSTRHEAEPWFQALLSFFYAEKDAPKAKRNASMVDYTLGGVALLDYA